VEQPTTLFCTIFYLFRVLIFLPTLQVGTIMDERAKRPPLVSSDTLWEDFGVGEKVEVHGLAKVCPPPPLLIAAAADSADKLQPACRARGRL